MEDNLWQGGIVVKEKVHNRSIRRTYQFLSRRCLKNELFFAVSRGGFGRDDNCQRLFSLNSSERKQSVCVNCWKMEKKSQALPETQFSKARHPLEFWCNAERKGGKMQFWTLRWIHTFRDDGDLKLVFFLFSKNRINIHFNRPTI